MCWKPCFCCEDGGAADRPVRHSSDGSRCDSGDVDGCADTRTGLAQYALVLPYELAVGRQRDKAGRGDECVEEEEGKSPPPEPRAIGAVASPAESPAGGSAHAAGLGTVRSACNPPASGQSCHSSDLKFIEI